MSQLTWGEINGPTDLANSAIAAGEPLTDSSIQAISANAKFAAVRTEFFYMGFWADGGTIPTPVSPVDGYAYSRAECNFFWSIYSNRAPGPGFVQGQASRPAQAGSQPAGLYNFPRSWDIDDSTGKVTMQTTYWDGHTETVTNDGIMKVACIAVRLSVNQVD